MNHQDLYNNQRSNTPHHKRLNRQRQEASRIQQRRDRFQTTRNISPSPVKEILIPLGPERADDKENGTANTTRFAKLVCNTNDPEKLTRQEKYLKRFVAYIDNKKVEKQKQATSNKKKPFISTVNSAKSTQSTCSIVPKGHPESFRPPVGLKNDVQMNTNKPIIKGRPSIYTIVPTPPRKNKQAADEKARKNFPIARKALPTNLPTKVLNSNKTPNAAATTSAKSNSRPLSTNRFNLKTPGDTQKPPNIRLNGKTPADNKKPPADNKKPPATNRLNFKTPAEKPKPPPLIRNLLKKPDMLPTTSSQANAAESQKPKKPQGGAVAKTRTAISKQTKKSPLKTGPARLADKSRVIKRPNNPKKAIVPNLQLNGKKMANVKKAIGDMILQTPKDFSLNPFEEFVTSTKLRNSSHNVESAAFDGISPLETSPKRPMESNRFNFMRYSVPANVSMDDDEEDNKDIEIKKLENNQPDKDNKDTEVKKLENNQSDEDNKDIEVKKLENNQSDEENKTLVNPMDITPTKLGPEERPSNYLSPFVTVARGKVSLRVEKEKRNSIYLSSSPKNSQKLSVEDNRTLEAVRYFRKQLQDEIDRLHQLCEVWEGYKNENLEKIQNSNVEDMINVTIGQTRLLTSKKFIQFKGLIDRCESGVTGIGAVENDGSEDTKPINAGDLEGFWSMLGIQVENLGKRFENLNRWKLNEWQDPDEVKNKTKKNLTKIKKAKKVIPAKANPNSALMQMMRKMQAEMRKNKNNNEEINGYVILTPSKQKQRRSTSSNNSTPRKSIDGNTSRRMSIVVKDRKYFSPAATVISVSSPNHRTSVNKRKTSQDSPKMLKQIEKFNEALNTMESTLDLRKSVLIQGNSRRMSINPQTPRPSFVNRASVDNDLTLQMSPQSPVPAGRKSILKTPGTARSRLRNVIFNEKLRVKNINFFVTDDNPLNAEDEEQQDDNNESHEEDLAPKDNDLPQRTLTLRNRKVRLRPSCEIVIPLK